MKRVIAFALLLVVIVTFVSCDLMNEIAEAAKVTVYSQDEVAEVDDFTLQIMGVSETQTIEALTEMKTANSYLVVDVKITNKTSLDKYLSSSDFVVKNRSHSFDQLPTESYWYGTGKDIEGFSYGQTIKAGLSARFYLVFEVPESVESSEYNLSFKPSTKTVEIKINKLTNNSEQGKEMHILNEIVTLSEQEFTILSYEFDDYNAAHYTPHECATGNCILTVYLNCKNNSNEKIGTDFFIFRLKYRGDYSYNSFYTREKEFFYGNISIVPLGTLSEVALAFEVPIEVRDSLESIVLECETNTYIDSQQVLWKLR